jgi:2-oxoisovalerate dehydrogenase E1 component alpha subunit
VTYRAGAHSTSDDPSRYRPRDEATAWPLGDPVARLKDHLVERGVWSESQHATLIEGVRQEVREAQERAETHGTLHSGPAPSPRDIFEGVYKEMPPHLVRQRRSAGY